MEFEQIVKQMEWLDNEHRKDKEALSALQAKIASLDSIAKALTKQIKDLNKVSIAAARLEQLDEILGKLRADVNKTIDDLEKKYQRRESEAKKRFQSELEGTQKAVADIRTIAGSAELKKKFSQQGVETERLANNISDLRKRVEESLHAFEESNHNMNLAEEVRRQELKRMTDIQGEITALRKRTDENREKVTLHGDKLGVIDNRLTELFTNEAKRDQSQAAFLQAQDHAQAERDRSWREWRDKYDAFQKEAESLGTQMQIIDETLRNAKRAQETYQELNTKLERRINEVMELQRLAEDRLRQEWVTFKAEDQKRWTGYTLTSEESFRDLRKDVQRLDKTVSSMDDLTQTMEDQLHQTTDTTESQLQELMNIVHQWITSYERIMGHGKKTPKKTGP